MTMQITKTLSLISLFCLMNISVMGQSTSSTNGDYYDSINGGYSVIVPAGARFARAGSLEDRFIAGMGKSYSRVWVGEGGRFESAYIRFNSKGTDVSTRERTTQLQAYIKNLINQLQRESGVSYVGERPTIVNGKPGREVIFQTRRGQLEYRIFATKQNLVTLAASYDLPEAKRSAVRFFLSLRLSSRDVMISEKVRSATPDPLPQVGKKVPSDLYDSGLKGPVRSMLVQRHDIDNDRPSAVGRVPTSQLYFDKAGNLSKAVEYMHDGVPEGVRVYGYIDGMRVSKSGDIPNEGILRVMAPFRPGHVPKARDARYSTRSAVKYDSEGRLSESLIYGNDGDLYSRSVYSYSRQQVEISDYSGSNVMILKRSQTLDANGRFTGEVVLSGGNSPSENRYAYEYSAFDRNGNWTRRSVLREFLEGGKVKYTWKSIEYRTITYYP